MRMSCNGCRVLRKGCSGSCNIRPCLQWIERSEAQANATVFLAKFYGRAGLINLIDAGPDNLRPAIFRSLLYEACGRIVNPIYGSVGLLWSGSWHLCQAAVEAVLKGTPITQISTGAAEAAVSGPLKTYDIRHVHKNCDAGHGAPGDHLHKLAAKSRTSFKRSGGSLSAANMTNFWGSESRDSVDGDSHEDGSASSAEGSHVSQGAPEAEEAVATEEKGLDLSLGLGPEGWNAGGGSGTAPEKRREREPEACHVRLDLGLAA
ncbi:LOB domain-containing protein 40-like [Canna indica]|uniref:LOB domain-containing protein 40-like n=1 Tax=Canna indica TaxID=4628 RepID=A0AAQ3L4M3_9LILI|nr:LOB domain-containing protein 40-like [Canna indica]